MDGDCGIKPCGSRSEKAVMLKHWTCLERATWCIWVTLIIALETGGFMDNTAAQFHLFILGCILSYNINGKCYFVSRLSILYQDNQLHWYKFIWPIFSFCCWAKPILSVIKLHSYKTLHHLFDCPRYKAYNARQFIWSHPYLSVL